MSLQIGDAVFPNLTAQPFGYEESNTRRGLTAKRWQVSGLLKPSEWLALLTAYDAWRDARIEDPSVLDKSGIGETVSLSGTGAGDTQWENVECWFVSAPSAVQQGAYLAVSVELVDATEALQVEIIQEEESQDIDYGTIDLGGAVIKLTAIPDTYIDGPQVELTATGVHYVTGALVPVRIKEIQGTTDSAGWNALRQWYESAVRSRPVADDLFPSSPPAVTGVTKKITEEGPELVYEVSITLVEII